MNDFCLYLVFCCVYDWFDYIVVLYYLFDGCFEIVWKRIDVQFF